MELSNSKGYFDFSLLLKNNPASVFYIVGQGGVGKSHSVKEYLIKNFIDNKERFIFVKQAIIDLKISTIETTFDDVMGREDIQDYIRDRLGFSDECRFLLRPQARNWILYVDTGADKIEKVDVVGKSVAISEAQRFKGGTYKGYTWIFYDEFISDHGYNGGDREPDYLEKISGTVGREDNPIKMVCCGNPDSQIELCPYLTRLHLDYGSIQANTPYFYDSEVIGSDGHTKRIGNNVCFLKIAHFNGRNYIHENVSGIFGGKEGATRATGERPDTEYMHITEQILDRFTPGVNLICETPVYKDEVNGDIYRVKLYAQIGSLDGAPAVFVYSHEKDMKNNKLMTIYSRWDINGYRKSNGFQINIVRMRFPQINFFSRVLMYLTTAYKTGMIFTNSNKTATWLADMLQEGGTSL